MAMPVWVSEIGVLSSSIIAFAAIFGERIRARLFRPKLRIALVDCMGEKETIDLAPSGSRTPDPADVRFYRLRVTNTVRYPAAREVEVLLTQFDKRGVDGQPDTIFRGALPLKWQYFELYGRTRTIAYTTDAAVDLLLLSQYGMRLTPIQSPINLGQDMLGEQHFWITVLARGLEGDSLPLRLRVDWNGNWSPIDGEMAVNFTIARD